VGANGILLDNVGDLALGSSGIAVAQPLGRKGAAMAWGEFNQQNRQASQRHGHPRDRRVIRLTGQSHLCNVRSFSASGISPSGMIQALLMPPLCMPHASRMTIKICSA
jgi:hypothetical protein